MWRNHLFNNNKKLAAITTSSRLLNREQAFMQKLPLYFSNQRVISVVSLPVEK